MLYSYYQYAEYGLDDDYRFLSLYPEYDNKGIVPFDFPEFTFEKENSPGLSRIRNEWDIIRVMGEGSELQRILKLKKWAFDLLCFPGKKLESRRYDHMDCFETIKTAKKERYSLNCRYISVIFTQILLAAGFRARWVSCLPMELNYCECHCVTEVFIFSLRKWIVVDLALNLLYFDRSNTVLNLYEMKSHILMRQPLRIQAASKERFEYIQEYWVRHVFRFKFLLNSKYNMLAAKNKIYVFLNPKGFVVDNKEIIHSDSDSTKLLHFYDNRLFWGEENV